MPYTPETNPIEDTVPQVDNEVAVGEDLEFQRKWWKFERAIWILLTIILVLDLLGAFGRGYLANHRVRTQNGALEVKYERVERFKAPSILTVNLGPQAIHDGKLQLWTSESLVTDLGNQRVIPQPLISRVGDGGTLYTFETTQDPITIQFALEPGKLGLQKLAIRVPHLGALQMSIFVMP